MSKLGKILLAESSKVIRLTFTRHLSNHFDIREESSGESAWQSLVLDHSVVAVVSGQNLARLDGLGLVARLRESKLSRLKRLPFFLMVPDSFTDADREKARAAGVTEFISREAASETIDAIVNSLVERFSGHVPATESLIEDISDNEPEEVGVRTDVGVSDILGQIGQMAGLDVEDADPDSDANDDGVLAHEMLEARLNQLMPEAKEGKGVGVLTFGLDGYEDLARKYGPELATRTTQKFSFLIARKIRPEDSIGQLSNGRIVIVAPATTRSVCAGFAARICQAMASAQISVRGQHVDLTVSAGVAVVPEDGLLLSGAELLALSERRMMQARLAGGSQTVSEGEGGMNDAAACNAFVDELKKLLASTEVDTLKPYLGDIGLQLMPLLKALESSFRFGLPLDEMSKRLWDRARAERMSA